LREDFNRLKRRFVPARAGEEVFDVVVVGCGPWGLAAMHTLRQAGHSVAGFEQGPRICQNLRTYMRGMTMHYPTPYMVLDSEDEILAKGSDHHPSIEDLVAHYERFAEDRGLMQVPIILLNL
jgi:cation diffusion facilitator CzcD-associated flavoprotein CzcO